MSPGRGDVEQHGAPGVSPPPTGGGKKATKELLPIVAAAELWGKAWQRVQVSSARVTIVAVINSGRAKYPSLNPLTAMPVFFCAHCNIPLSAEYIEGRQNAVTDVISRNLSLSPFPQLFPSLAQVPPPLTNQLLDTSLLWSSPAWRKQFLAFLGMV